MKNRIIATAINLYTQRKTNGINMNDIATELQITKQVLNIHFTNKNLLVLECLISELEKLTAVLEKTESESSSPLLSILNINKNVLKQMSKWNSAFLCDLNNSPKAKTVMNDYYNHNYKAKIQNLIQQSVKEEYFNSELNLNMVLKFLTVQLKTAVEEYRTGQTEDINIYTSSVKIFLMGICTNKGLEELNKIKTSII